MTLTPPHLSLTTCITTTQTVHTEPSMHIHGQSFKVSACAGETVDSPYFNKTVRRHGRETNGSGVVPLDLGHSMSHCHILAPGNFKMMTHIGVAP